jgi:SAM-dependent methyltransferase
MKRGRPSTGPHEAGADGATESHPCGRPSERLHPGTGDRNYLHLAPITQILEGTIPTILPGARLRVLDLGCGSKPYAPLFLQRCESYVGVDLQLPSSADVLAAGDQLPFRNGSFDVVLCTQVLEHDPEPQRTVAEAHRVLSPGGTLLLSTHGVWFKHGEADYWRWTDAGLRRLMRSFPAVEVYNCGGQYSALFQILNLYADPLPLGRRLLYLVNNTLGLALDRVLPAENLIVNYVVVAGK